MTDKPYFPHEYFSGDSPPETSPRVIIAPHRYIQGNGVIDKLGHYISVLNSNHPVVLISRGGYNRMGDRVLKSLAEITKEPTFLFFEGECSNEEVDRQVKQLANLPIDSLIAIGGGKCLDTGKCVAYCKSVPVVICPTLASTDAPCSAVAVMHSPEGAFERPWFFPESPSLVVVDSGIIASSPLRHIVAGMGDALATYYEARTCFNNPKARSMVGARPTLTAIAIAETGARALFAHGEAAVSAIKDKIVNEAVENVIEANTLISGIGFESGGLAASHGVAEAFSAIPLIAETYLHGEMVAIGLLTHLCLEEDIEEAKRVAQFSAKVGLPVHLGQLSMDLVENAKEIELVIDSAMNVFFIHYEPFAVTPEKIKKALLKANQIGLQMSEEIGDNAYSCLHQ